ncbi:MAG TPA: hypothetical protein VJ456_19140, partial [Acidimicrobiia bacterium]|nr:hypothetical protein [Acidimicrobiia bacterium]
MTVECRPGEPPAVWAFPDDPALPGLPAAADGRLARRRLRPRPADVAVEPLRYRPRRRAVLRYRVLNGGRSSSRAPDDGGPSTRLVEAGGGAGNRQFFVKVLSPGRARRLLEAADALRAGDSAATPVEPRLRLALPAGRLGPGVLVLPPLRRRALRDLLLAGGPLPEPDRLAGLPETLHRRCLSALGPGGGAGDRASVRVGSTRAAPSPPPRSWPGSCPARPAPPA